MSDRHGLEEVGDGNSGALRACSGAAANEGTFVVELQLGLCVDDCGCRVVAQACSAPQCRRQRFW